jgi:DEAD/DEAH box helicase domain-containing protein
MGLWPLTKEGKWDELKKYCLDDVLVTKDLFEHGVEKGFVMYKNERGVINVDVNWKKYKDGNGTVSDMPLTLPF